VEVESFGFLEEFLADDDSVRDHGAISVHRVRRSGNIQIREAALHFD
jgi:hypothetical protein